MKFLKGSLALLLLAQTAGQLKADQPVAAETPIAPVAQVDHATVERLLRRLEEAESRIIEANRRIETLQDQLQDINDQVEPQIGQRVDQAPSPYLFTEDTKKEDGEKADKKKEDAELDKRLKKLEDDWKKSKEKPKESGPFKPTLKVFGRMHIDAIDWPTSTDGIGFLANPDPTDSNFGDDPENRVLFRRLRIGVGGELTETVFYKLEMEFANPNDPEFKDAYMGVQELPYLQTVILGNQKRPLGLDALNSSRYNIFMERPLVIQAVNPDERRFGLAAYGVNDDETMTWTNGVYMTEQMSQTGSINGDPNVGNVSINNRVTWLPWYDEASGGRGFLHLGLANMWANNDASNPPPSNANQARFSSRPELRSVSRWIDTGRIATANWWDSFGYEAWFNAGSFSMVSEAYATWVDRGAGDMVYFPGWYVYASYILTGEHHAIERDSATIARLKPFENFFLVPSRKCRGTGWGAWEVAARYSMLDLTDDDITGGHQQDVTLCLNWYWNPNTRITLNYVAGWVDQFGPIGGFTSGDFTGLGARFMIDY